MSSSQSDMFLKKCKETLSIVKKEYANSIALAKELSKKLMDQERIINLLSDQMAKLETQNKQSKTTPNRRIQTRASAKVVTNNSATTTPTTNQQASLCDTPISDAVVIDDRVSDVSNTPTTSQLNEVNIPLSEIQNQIQISDENAWKKVTHKRKKSSNLLIKGCATDTNIDGVDMMKFVHGCFFNKNSSTDSVKIHLNNVQTATYIVEHITSKRDDYKSYKIGIPSSVYEHFMSPSAWPVHVIIKQWQPFLYNLSSKSRRSTTAPTNRFDNDK